MSNFCQTAYMTDCRKEAIEKMNRLGKKGVPFLFISDFEARKLEVLELQESTEENVFFDIKGFRNAPQHIHSNHKAELRAVYVPYPVYQKSISGVIEEQKKGNSYLLNLTFPTEIKCNMGLREIFDRAQAPYKLLYKNNFTVFSPESFVKIENGYISSFPMKGTIDASLPEAAAILLGDPKEAAEHATIVDLIRNDLSRFATDVKVARYRYLEEVKSPFRNLLQASSEITGKMPDGYSARIGDYLAMLLPAGSISGAPKKKTVEIIKQAEIDKRGFYTGVFGIFDGKNLDSAVMIRFIEQKDDKMYFRSGGGITAQSDPEKEYQEMKDKVYLPIY